MVLEEKRKNLRSFEVELETLKSLVGYDICIYTIIINKCVVVVFGQWI